MSRAVPLKGFSGVTVWSVEILLVCRGLVRLVGAGRSIERIVPVWSVDKIVTVWSAERVVMGFCEWSALLKRFCGVTAWFRVKGSLDVALSDPLKMG